MRWQVSKAQGQDYKLLWRDTPDFVRMAAKTNAIVIPFAVVGAEEAYDIFMDSNQVVHHQARAGMPCRADTICQTRAPAPVPADMCAASFSVCSESL